MIRTILIDDEPKALAILQNKIERFCPEIEIIVSTQYPKKGIELIKNLKPELLFLDVSMPEMTGFEMLQKIEKPKFEIIFETAYDDYAIEAINNCAIGYLVKPIDNEDLVKAVKNAAKSIQKKMALEKNQILIENLSIKKFQDKKAVIPTQDGLEFIEINQILHCEGTEGYTKIHFKNRKPILSSQSIGHFAKMFDGQDFYLVHKSHLVNLYHIDKYLNEGSILIEHHKIPVSRNRRNEF
ncbi:MAG: response regulator transcription factor, partial [Flavobacteriaceae bacterium]|nr:response regulator transcription factor [Flavobacteriaceae bacterium]